MAYLKKYLPVFLFLILLIDIGLRSIHHSDWLVFKSDQARDALIMHRALNNGFSSLPLIGPEAGSTGFHLGPISYYFQYVSGKIFGGTAESFAYPDLFFGILTIPLLFFLFRKFFPLPLTLWLTALSSTSFFLVTFSRFSWNPNSLPFFTTLFALLLLDSMEKAGRARYWRLILVAISIGVIAQLHLVAIAALGIGLIFFTIFSKAFRPVEILSCALIIVILQFPLFLNEYRTAGENTKAFLGSASGERYNDQKHAWYEKTFRAYQDSARVTWLLLSGRQNTDTILTRNTTLLCDKKCREALPYSLLALGIFSLSIALFFHRYHTEKEPIKKRALVFIGFWLGSFFLITIPIAYEVETRFYLGIVPPLLIFLGIAGEELLKINVFPWKKYILIAIGIFLLSSNVQVTVTYLSGLRLSQTSTVESSKDLRFGTETKVTLGQLRAIAHEAESQFSKDTPIFISGESHHVKSLFYVLSDELGYQGCYVRGKTKNAPSGFHHLFIEEYDPGTKNAVPFGTLGAVFEASPSKEGSPSLPKGCLTY